MKKIALIILTMITLPTYATTMCAANDTVAVVLDPSISGINYGYNSNDGSWVQVYSYGRVSGISACLSSTHGQVSCQGAVAHLYDTDNNGKTKLVTGSEFYGTYCWCRITHPVKSLWTYRSPRGNTCAATCAEDCAKTITAGYKGFREAMYRTISN